MACGSASSAAQPRRRIPVVALHAAAATRDRRHRERMARLRVAGHETARIGQHELVATGVHVGALGVDDLPAHRKSGVLGAAGDLDGALRIELPGMEQVQIQRVALELLRIGQSGGLVDGRVARDVVGRLRRLADRRPGKIGRRGMAAALAQVHGDAQPLVARVLDGLDLSLARGHRQSGRFARLAGAIAGAQLARMRQHLERQFAQPLLRNRKRVDHVRGFGPGPLLFLPTTLS